MLTTDLAGLARRYVAADWPFAPRFDPTQRWYQRLATADDHEAWVLTWLPGQGTDLHDHGGGGASFPDATDSDDARRAIREHLAHGTTSLVASLVTADRDTLLARMQATVFTVEGLVARTAEVLAMSASGGLDLSADRLAGLSGDLDGLRAGLAEAEEVSRRVLDG